MKSLLFVPLCLLFLTACGSDSDNKKDNPVQAEQPAPTNEDNSGNNTASRFTTVCRLATEIEGSNFQYEWSTRQIGDRLAFDTAKNQVRVASTNGTPPTNAATYTVVPPEAGTMGSQGTIKYSDFELFFPVIPFGTIKGSTQEYLIGTLSRGDADLGTYLCSKRLQSELR